MRAPFFNEETRPRNKDRAASPHPEGEQASRGGVCEREQRPPPPQIVAARWVDERHTAHQVGGGRQHSPAPAPSRRVCEPANAEIGPKGLEIVEDAAAHRIEVACIRIEDAAEGSPLLVAAIALQALTLATGKRRPGLPRERHRIEADASEMLRKRFLYATPIQARARNIDRGESLPNELSEAHCQS